MENLIDLSFDESDNCPSIDNKDSTDFTVKALFDREKNSQCDPLEFGKKDACAKEVTTNIIAQGVQVADLLSIEEGYLIDLENDSNKTRNFCSTTTKMCSSVSFNTILDESNLNSPKLKNDSMEQKFVLRNQQKSAFQTLGSRTLSKDTPTHISIGDHFCSDFFGKESPQMIASESPLKLVDDDLILSDSNFEADLEQLNIPMLQTMSAKSTSSKHTDYRTQVLKQSLTNCATQTPDSERQTHIVDDRSFQQAEVLTAGKSYTLSKPTMSLNNGKQPLEKSTEATKKSVKNSKASQRSSLFNENQNPEERSGRVSTVSLSENLHTVMATPVSHFDCASLKFQSCRYEKNNNERTHELLSELRTIIRHCVVNDEKRDRANYLLDIFQSCLPNSSDFPPQFIVRQKTFDIEIQESPGQEEQKNNSQRVMQDEKIDKVFKQPRLLQNIHIVEGSETKMMQNDEVNDIVKQAMFSLQQTGRDDACNEDKIRNCDTSAPTVIVVMNPIPVQTQIQTVSNVASKANSLDEHHLDKVTYNPPPISSMRRRSMSLSLHDKIKNQPQATQTDANIASTVSKDAWKASDLKTPRRRSYSINSSAQKPMSMTTTKKLCEKLTIDSNKNTNEMRKHLKNSLSVNAITSSAGSLKSTTPVKKVTPIIKTSMSADHLQARPKTLNTPIIRQTAKKPYSGGLYTTLCKPSYPNACSTPTVKRHSYLSQPTASKANATTIANSRQSLAKPKTPTRARY